MLARRAGSDEAAERFFHATIKNALSATATVNRPPAGEVNPVLRPAYKSARNAAGSADVATT